MIFLIPLMYCLFRVLAMSLGAVVMTFPFYDKLGGLKMFLSCQLFQSVPFFFVTLHVKDSSHPT